MNTAQPVTPLSDLELRKLRMELGEAIYHLNQLRKSPSWDLFVFTEMQETAFKVQKIACRLHCSMLYDGPGCRNHDENTC
jgi:hypothetical protein